MMRAMRGIAAAATALSLAGCVPASVPPSAERRPPPPVVVAVPETVPPGAVPRPPAALARAIAALGSGFDGVVGIAVRDVQAGWTVSYNGARPLPQQSVSKLWVAMTVLDAVDRGVLRLDQPVVVRREDLTLFNQPIRALVDADGHSTTIEALLDATMTRSDNTANDVLLGRAGGSAAVRALIARHGLDGIGFGPGERLLQSRIAGVEWRPDYSIGRGFEAARAALPFERREAAMRAYLANPMDGASPDGMVMALARLRKGELLSPASTQLLLAMMARSRTGPQRLRAGLGPEWALAHKTGTGQDLAGLGTGYNDVGLLTAPDGATYAVAVMIASTRRPIPDRQRLMSSVTRAVVAQHGTVPAMAVDSRGGDELSRRAAALELSLQSDDAP